MSTQISDRELTDAIQNKLDAKGSTFSFAIKAMIQQYLPAGTAPGDPTKIPQNKRAAFLARLDDL